MVHKVSRILADDGPIVVAYRGTRFARRRLAPKAEIELPVMVEDVLAARRPPKPAGRRAGARRPPRRGADRLAINWVIAPLAKGSGGHHTILRFVRYLEDHGHTCNLILYDGIGVQARREAAVIAARHFPPMNAQVRGVKEIADCDVLIATAWQTAYPVFNADTAASKFYFVQDYEPLFYPAGTLNTLAEHTYRLGLHGITAGAWLSGKLQREFGMNCDHFDFGSDAGRYRFENSAERRKVVFYARPKTPRRGFELGVLALAEFARRNPEYEINFIGSAVDYRLPFPFVSRGVLDVEQLNELYNQAAAALVISLTNMSLLPLELLAAGCIPVVTDGENNRLVSDNPYIAYADPTPFGLADALDRCVHHADLPSHAAQAAASVTSLSWDDAGHKVERIIARALPGASALAVPEAELEPVRWSAHG